MQKFPQILLFLYILYVFDPVPVHTKPLFTNTQKLCADKQQLPNFNSIPQMLQHLESTSHCALKKAEWLLHSVHYTLENRDVKLKKIWILAFKDRKH